MTKKSRWRENLDSDQDEIKDEESSDFDAIEQPEDQPLTREDEPPKIESVVEQLPTVPLRVYAKICGHKWDQMAGFVSFAKSKKLGSRTVPEWRVAYASFLRKPVR